MDLRSLERDRIGRIRTECAGQLALLERVLEFSASFFTGVRIAFTENDKVAVSVLLGFHRKIVTILWAIVVLAERGLPVPLLARELLEALVSVAYIIDGDSLSPGLADLLGGLGRGLDGGSPGLLDLFGVRAGESRAGHRERKSTAELAQLCIDYALIQKCKSTMARWCFPGPGPEPDSGTQVDPVMLEYRLGTDRMQEMMGWKGTWSGHSMEEMVQSLEKMAWRGEILRTVYTTAVAYLECGDLHGLDWSDLIDVPADGVVESNLPERLDWPLLAATCSWTLTALQLIGERLGVDRKAELQGLRVEIEKLYGSGK